MIHLLISVALAQTPSNDDCRVYKVSEARAITQACPIITDADFIEARRVCLSVKKQQSPACIAARAEIDSRLTSLRSQYELMVQKKQAEANGYSLSSSPELSKFYDDSNHILTMISDASTSSKCDVTTTANSLIPFVSLFAPGPGFMIGAGASLLQKLMAILKTSHMGIADKLAVCSANQSFKDARTKACTTAALNEPELHKKSVGYSATISMNTERGKKTKTYALATGYAKFLNQMQQLRSDGVNSTQRDSLQAQDTLTQVISNLDTRKPVTAICISKLSEVKRRLGMPLLRNGDSDTAQRTEEVNRLVRMVHEIPYDCPGLTGWTFRTGNGQTILTTNLTADSDVDGYWGLEAYTCDVSPDNCEANYMKRSLQDSNYDSAAEVLKTAFDRVPAKISSSIPVESLCAATACIWGPSSQSSQHSALTDQWDATGKQSLATYTAAGAQTYVGWAQLISPSKDLLKNLGSRCQSSAAKCELSCSPFAGHSDGSASPGAGGTAGAIH